MRSDDKVVHQQLLSSNVDGKKWKRVIGKGSTRTTSIFMSSVLTKM